MDISNGGEITAKNVRVMGAEADHLMKNKNAPLLPIHLPSKSRPRAPEVSFQRQTQETSTQYCLSVEEWRFEASSLGNWYLR